MSMEMSNDKDAKLINKDYKNEKGAYDSNLLFSAIYEAVGTMMFVCIIYYCGGDVTKFALGFWVILTLFGGLSGAHVNPAITLGFYVYEGEFSKGLSKLLLYWAGQFLGAFIGALISKPLFNKDVFVQGLAKDFIPIFWAEFFFTGTFCFVILYVCSKKINIEGGSAIKCGIIVAWFYAIVNAGSTISGAAYNPAILTILNMFAEYDNLNAASYLPVMISAQLIGVTTFSLIFKYGFENFIEKNKSKNE